MADIQQGFFSLAFSRQVVWNAFNVALVVGTILAFINHGGAILAMSLELDSIVKIALTYFVPYGVSTYSAVRALESQALQ